MSKSLHMTAWVLAEGDGQVMESTLDQSKRKVTVRFGKMAKLLNDRRPPTRDELNELESQLDSLGYIFLPVITLTTEEIGWLRDAAYSCGYEPNEALAMPESLREKVGELK